MRKIFSLCTFVAVYFILSTGVAFAANWQWIASDDLYGIFFDTDTIRYLSTPDSPIDETTIICWEKCIHTQKAADKIATAMEDPSLRNLKYTIELKAYSLSERRYIIIKIAGYGYDGKLLFEIDGSKKPLLIYPDSRAETLYKSIRDYASRHHDELVEHTLGNK